MSEYGTATGTNLIGLYSTTDIITLKANKVYSMSLKYLNGTLVGGMTKLDGATYEERADSSVALIIVGDSDINFITNIAPKFQVKSGTNYGTIDNPTQYKCMLVEGDYSDSGLTFFPYETADVGEVTE